MRIWAGIDERELCVKLEQRRMCFHQVDVHSQVHFGCQRWSSLTCQVVFRIVF